MTRVALSLKLSLIILIGCQSPKVEVNLANARWEPIFFRLINRVTDLSNIKELRKTHVNEGDVHVRVWRGFGIGNLEGVVLTRINGQWSATHIKADDYSEPENVEVIKLDPP